MARRVVSLLLVPLWLLAQAVRLPHAHHDDGHEHHGQTAQVHFHMFWPDHDHHHQHEDEHAGQPADDHRDDYPVGDHKEDAIPLPDCLVVAAANVTLTVD